MSKRDKKKDGLNAFEAFFEQFGPNDIYKRILMEEIFEMMCNSKEGSDGSEKRRDN